MSGQNQRMSTAIQTTNLADLVERILDKGVVISGDIKVKLVDVELLTIQIRLVICSVDKAAEIGLDWWNRSPDLIGSRAADRGRAVPEAREMQRLAERVRALEDDARERVQHAATAGTAAS